MINFHFIEVERKIFKYEEGKKTETKDGIKVTPLQKKIQQNLSKSK